MPKFAITLSAFIVLATWATAQVPTSGNVFFGYSYERTVLFPATSST
ncbi:MAG: hypothetical protein WBV31_04760 [Terriglobales bacterium]|jgi:hypothetical protein